MIISVDSQANMAYIYLQKPKLDDSIWRNVDNKKILKYLDGREPEISIESGEKDLVNRLLELRMSSSEYMNDLNNCIFGEDWQNDKDSDKYIKGVELSFTKEMFLENIKNDAYKIYTLEWLNKAFILISLANNNLLFDKSNILYPVNQNKDTFYIVAIVGRIAYIRGVLTCRYGKEDKYEIDYLKEANFIIYEGDGND